MHTPVQALLNRARFADTAVMARDAAIEKKDVLEARGYSWSAGEIG